MVLHQNELIAKIKLGREIPGNLCKSFYCDRKGTVWLGTNKGINRIEYAKGPSEFCYTNTFFGVADGLIGEQVNAITVYQDTVYAATVNGISYFPASLSLPVKDIQTIITGIQINNLKTNLSPKYTLPYYKNDITIFFTGIDLTGYQPYFEYKINNSSWVPAEKIELKRLASGTYEIRIRAIRRDGTPSEQYAKVVFVIKKPIWEKKWFWIALAALFFGLILYYLQKRNKAQQEAAVQKALTEKKLAELEMQALMAQMNPHFILNCLNSIKGFIFIYEKNFEQANKYLDTFSELLRSTLLHTETTWITVSEEKQYLKNTLSWKSCASVINLTIILRRKEKLKN
ncbi:MAG: histidine kinase [Chitinophagaceae bacterium]|nr:histidine kinase [Chitinophagaceae bacterium]